MTDLSKQAISGMDVVEVARQLRETFKPSNTALGNPGPLGLAAFALTTFVLSCYNAGLIDDSTQNVVLPLALWYGGTAQMLAGMWEFYFNNSFGATAFTSYGFFWISYATFVWFVVPSFIAADAPARAIDSAVGIYLFSWLIFSSYMMVASFRVSVVLSLVFATLVPALTCLTIGAFPGPNQAAAGYGWTKAGGVFGIICAWIAWYGSAAAIINITWQREVLPLGVIKPSSSDEPAPLTVVYKEVESKV